MMKTLGAYVLILLYSLSLNAQQEIMNPGISAGIFWKLLGNSSTDPTIHFVGTTDAQPLIIRTNSNEVIRVNTSGNVGIGTILNSARLHVYTPDSVLNPYGIYNRLESGYSFSTMGIYTNNNTATGSIKYGIYNFTSSAGTGGRIGIYNYVSQNAAATATATATGMSNEVYFYGTSTNYGILNTINHQGSGLVNGISTTLTLPLTFANTAIGQRTTIAASSGERYGEYKEMITSSLGAGSVFGDYNLVNGTGNGEAHGVYNQFVNSGTGIKSGLTNEFQDVQGLKRGVTNIFAAGTTTGNQFGLSNTFQNTSTSVKYGVYNSFGGTDGTKYGLYNNFTGPGGTFYGTYTLASSSTITANQYGNYNYLGGTGSLRGSYNLIAPATTATTDAYAVYGSVSQSGNGTHYGGYFTAAGTGNYSLYAINTVSGGWAGYFEGNTQVATLGRIYALYGDYTNDVIRFGALGSLWENGTVINGNTVDYVADFDKGIATGTAIGIGSVEYLLDGTNCTYINNTFSPPDFITNDLGLNTTTEAWDDVFADDYWNVSDIREKESVENMNYGLKELLKLRTISYYLKRDPFHEHKIGLVAQDVLPLIPEVVKTHNYLVTDESKPDEYNKVELDRLALNYSAMVPVLIKAIQEQQQMMDAQQKRIEELKAQNEKMLLRIQQLEQSR